MFIYSVHHTHFVASPPLLTHLLSFPHLNFMPSYLCIKKEREIGITKEWKYSKVPPDVSGGCSGCVERCRSLY